MKKIAFCFLIYDEINLEELWNQFFTGVDKDKYTIYIHYKTNKTLTYFEKYKLTNCIETKWGELSLVKAQNLLLSAAITDPDNKHFILLSNSCIPLKSFDHIYEHLDEPVSYFNMANQNACFPRCNTVLAYIPRESIQKASQWCILNRKHTELLLNTAKDYYKRFALSPVPDEHCYITALYVHHLQNEIVATQDLSNGATTFVNWSKGFVNYYKTIDKKELIFLLNSKCFFGRKFDKMCFSDLIIDEYIDCISKT